MSKSSNTTRSGGANTRTMKVAAGVDEKAFDLNNYQLNAYLRGYEDRSGKTPLPSEKAEAIASFLDKKMRNSKLQEGTVYRGIGFHSRKELNDFIDTNIVFTSGTYKDKGFAFVSYDKVHETFGGQYSVELKFENARYLPYTEIRKQFASDRGIMPRNEPYSVTKVEGDGKHYKITLRRK